MAFSTGQAEMNVTPLIDILLVLIIIFMIIVPVAPVGQNADIPRDDRTAQGDPPPARTIVIQLHGVANSSAIVSINEQPVAWEELKTTLFNIYKQRAEKVAFVQADAELNFEQVAQAIDIAHAAGVDHVGLK